MDATLGNVLCRTTPVKRSAGHTAIGGAAYRAGENLRAYGQGENGTDKIFRYSPRKDVVRETFIMTPKDGAPDYLQETDDKSELRSQRMRLWNEVEQMENGKNARLGREIQVGFAYELSHDDQRALLRNFVEQYVTEGGTQEVNYQVKTKDGKKRIETKQVDVSFVADVAIHDYGKRIPFVGASDQQQQRIRDWAEAGIPFLTGEQAKGFEGEHVRENYDRNGNIKSYQIYNPHAHVRITPRTVSDGEWTKDKFASRHLNDPNNAMNWRYDWANLQNAYLERTGSDVRVTCTPEDLNGAPVYDRKAKENHTARNIEERLAQTDEPKSEETKQSRERQREVNEAVQERLDANDEFEAARKDNLRDAQIEHFADEAGPQHKETEQFRITEWYRNIGQCLDHWREAIPAKAAEWRERLGTMKPRLKAWFGYEVTEPQNEPLLPSADETNGGDHLKIDHSPGQERPEPEPKR